MNITSALANAKREIGLGAFLKPRRSDRQLINEIVLPITLPTFSRYFKNRLNLYSISLIKDDLTDGLYKMDIPKQIQIALDHYDMKIKGVCSLKINKRQIGSPSIYGRNILYSPVQSVYSYRSNFALEDTASAFATASALESVDLGTFHQFIEPNKIEFFEHDLDFTDLLFDIVVFTSHSNNLSTIGNNISNSFMKLLKLDLKRILYEGEFKYLNNIETPYIKVDLKIDDWAQASNEREQLLKEWEGAPFANNGVIANT